VIGYNAGKESMTLRRAILDQFFDSRLQDIAHVYFGRHLAAFPRRTVSANIKTEPSRPAEAQAQKKLIAGLLPVYESVANLVGKLQQYGTKARE
jgi:hypothetical protein